MIFDTGASHAFIHPEIASRVKIERFHKVTDNPLPGYRVPFTIVGLPPIDIDVYVNLDERKTLLPPKIFTKIYSINFA